MSNTKKNAPANESKQMGIVIGVLIAVIVVIVAVGVVLAVDVLKVDHTGEADMTAIRAEINSLAATDFTETEKTTEYVKLSIKGHGDIILRLRPDIAPLTVENFQKLVAEDFYDGLTIHRVAETYDGTTETYKDFVIQGGDPKGNGSGSSDKKIKGEFSANGVRNDLNHIKGVISMARGEERNSASCQFFICSGNAANHLDGYYAGFGYVVAGLEVVDSVADVKVDDNDKPLEAVVIEKACFVKKN